MAVYHDSFYPSTLDVALWDQVAAAITVLDLDGAILFYNEHAPRILDRKPEYIGRDVCDLHKPASATKIRAMLEAYQNGEAKEFTWRVSRGDKEFVVRLSPLVENGRIKGAVHVAMVLP